MVLVDAGIVGEPLATPDVTREEVAAAVGADVAALAAAGDRGAAVETMARGAAEIVKRLHAEGRLDAIGGLGGSGGSSLVTYAMRQLPIGVPKLMVSTVASGDTSPYVGSVDVTMMYSVVDIAGVNRGLGADHDQRRGRARGHGEGERCRRSAREAADRRASMFGVTTAAVTDGARAARGARLRGARLPPDRRGRRLDGGADRGRLHRRLARRDDDRVLRPGRGRRARRRARSGSSRRARRASRRSSRSARSTWSTSGRWTRCRSATATGTSTSTTRRSP